VTHPCIEKVEKNVIVRMQGEGGGRRKNVKTRKKDG